MEMIPYGPIAKVGFCEIDTKFNKCFSATENTSTLFIKDLLSNTFWDRLIAMGFSTIPYQWERDFSSGLHEVDIMTLIVPQVIIDISDDGCKTSLLGLEIIKSIFDFVEGGGGLVLITDANHHADNPFWRDFSSDVCNLDEIKLLPFATESNESLVFRFYNHGKGRIAVVYVLKEPPVISSRESTYHKTWDNLFQWAGSRAFSGFCLNNEQESEAHKLKNGLLIWNKIKDLIEHLKELQNSDSKINEKNCVAASDIISQLIPYIGGLSDGFSHQKNYLSACIKDFKKWERNNFLRPDFSLSVATFNTQYTQLDGLHFIAIFPMYLPNARADFFFDAVLFQTCWPEWLHQVNTKYVKNNLFIPGLLIDYTSGYSSQCAVLFSDMVCANSRTAGHFGVIFCNREFERFILYTKICSKTLNFMLPIELENLLSSYKLARDSYMLWDLLHDKNHTLGHLPLDPFIIRQRMPYWMYAIEELRVDVATFLQLREIETCLGLAKYAKYTILFDRLFRFPIVGSKVKNYDGLDGQILFGALFNRKTISWNNLTFVVRWEKLDCSMQSLHDDIKKLTRIGVNSSPSNYWVESYKFVCKFVRPEINSA